MAQLLVRDISTATVHRLKRRAREAGRSLEAEARQILETHAHVRTMGEARAAADRIRAKIGPQKTDSAELIREDRDR
jgi:plasmid stability protein